MSREPKQKFESKRLGQILESKDGKSMRIVFDKDVSFEKGDSVFINDYESHLQFLVDAGHKTEEEAAELFAKTGFVKYILGKDVVKAN